MTEPHSTLSTRPDVPLKWVDITPPTDDELDWHANWIAHYREDRTPGECFYCWHLERRDEERP